jgi:hypothetical protein
MKTPQSMFLIWSFEHDAWWAPERCGYTKDIAKAGMYSLEEAGQICIDASYSGVAQEVMLPAECRENVRKLIERG